MISEEAKNVISKSAFITLVTINPDGSAHPIVAGKGEVQDDKIIFGIYKMEKTQQNLLNSPDAWAAAAVTEGGPKGYRFAGTAAAEGKQLIFTVSSSEELL